MCKERARVEKMFRSVQDRVCVYLYANKWLDVTSLDIIFGPDPRKKKKA